MKKFLRGFGNAFAGIAYTFKTQRNMRIHITIAALVCLFAYVYGLTEGQRVLLSCAIALVLIGETVNTAIESAVDTATTEYHPNAKHAKDTAAGAVLLAAVFAVAAAVMIFLDADKLGAAFAAIFASWQYILGFAAIFILGVAWIAWGGKREQISNHDKE